MFNGSRQVILPIGVNSLPIWLRLKTALEEPPCLSIQSLPSLVETAFTALTLFFFVNLDFQSPYFGLKY